MRELVRNVVRYNEEDFGVGKGSGLGVRDYGEEKGENQKNEDETKKEHVEDGEIAVNEEEVEEIEQEQIGASNKEGKRNREIRPINLEVEGRRYFTGMDPANLVRGLNNRERALRRAHCEIRKRCRQHICDKIKHEFRRNFLTRVAHGNP